MASIAEASSLFEIDVELDGEFAIPAWPTLTI